MLKLTIPGREVLELHHLVLDYNGTIAFDGLLIPGVAERIHELGEVLSIHVITADTNGTVAEQCAELPVSIDIIGRGNQEDEKRVFVNGLQPQGAVCIGNGANDAGMFEAADLAIAVMGHEGCATSALIQSDITAHDIVDALDLLIHQNRVVATLRK